jgi:energy-converting hydrogenase Eha subunit H
MKDSKKEYVKKIDKYVEIQHDRLGKKPLVVTIKEDLLKDHLNAGWKVKK